MQNENEILWTAGFLNERFTKIVSPLGWSFVGSLFEQLALRDPLRYMGYPAAETIPATQLWHGHPYINSRIFQIFYKPFPDFLVPADAVRYFPNSDPNFRKLAPYPRSIIQPRLLFSLAYHLLRDPVTTLPLNYLAWERFVPYHDAETAKLAKRLDKATDARDVLSVIDATSRLDAQLLHIHRWSLTYADVFYKLLHELTGANAQDLISGVPNKTSEVNQALSELAHASSPLDARLLERISHGEPLNAQEVKTAQALDLFLAEHGHRAFSLDIAQPTFRDDPTQLLPLMSDVESIREPGRIVDPAANIVNASHFEPIILNPLISLARTYAKLREDQRYYWQKSLATTRRAFLLLGTDLSNRGIIEQPSEIFYAERNEITAYYQVDMEPDELAQVIAARQIEWAEYAARQQPLGESGYPLFLMAGSAVHFSGQEQRVTRNEWRGRGVSGGIARGRARVIRDPDELGRVNAGEILVTPSTDPAWTPVFGRLAGLVLERGGVLSHGAVVAREYRLPAVAAIPGITSKIKDGEWLEVDGTEGVVRRVTQNKEL